MALWIGITEFEAYLVATGLLRNPVGENDPAGFFDLAGLLASAQSEFERRVGWRPFLASDAASDLLLDAEMYPSLDLVSASGTGAYDITGINVSGTDFLYGVQSDGRQANVFGYPQNANARDFPVTTLRFYPGYYFGAGSWAGKQRVTVTARWGRVLLLPPDVKTAVMSYAAGLLLPTLILARTGGAQKVREGDEEIDYGSGGGGGGLVGSLSAMQMGMFDKAVLRWKRVGLA